MRPLFSHTELLERRVDHKAHCSANTCCLDVLEEDL